MALMGAYVRFNFATRNVLGKLFAAGFTRNATRVLPDRAARLLHRLAQALGGVRCVVRIAEIELHLLRVGNVPLAATAKHFLQQRGVSKL